MSISRKYPIFLLLTTMGTAFAIFFAMREVLRSSLEKEILKRGAATAEVLAVVNAPPLAAGDTAQLEYNVLALAADPDIVDARVVDTRGVILASLNKKEVGAALSSSLLAADAPSAVFDRARYAYFFRTDIRRAGAQLGAFVLSVSRTPLDAPLALASRRALVFASGVAAAMFIFGLLLVRHEVRPLKLLSLAFARIARGEFTERLQEERKDEIGALTTGFNYMAKRIELLSYYNDKMIVERLIADESLTRPGGHLRDLGVLFGDMRGYTAMSNRRTADQVVRIVNTYFHLYIECIAHWGGYVDKTMGDAIMALFERPEGDPAESHKRRGVLALCYMKASSRVLNEFLYQRRQGGEELEIEPREFGFAMATGRAIVGNIGSERRMDYTVCGRVVNLASRLEGLTKHGEVIIDNFTLKGTRDFVRDETLPAVQPKGFSEAEMVVPHRVTAIGEEETQRLRVFLKRLFTYSFVHSFLMPSHLTAGQEQPWCKEAELVLLKLIAETPVSDFFARREIETGKRVETAPATLAATSAVVAGK